MQSNPDKKPKMTSEIRTGTAVAAGIAAGQGLSLKSLLDFARSHLTARYPDLDGVRVDDVSVRVYLSRLANGQPDLLLAAAHRLRAREDLVAILSAATGRTPQETRQNLSAAFAAPITAPGPDAPHEANSTKATRDTSGTSETSDGVGDPAALGLLAQRLTRVVETIRRLDEEVADADIVSCRNCSTALPAGDEEPCPYGQDNAGQHDPDHVTWEPDPGEPPTRRIGVAFELSVPNDGYDYATDVTGRLEQLLSLLLLHPHVSSAATGGPTGSGYTGHSGG